MATQNAGFFDSFKNNLYFVYFSRSLEEISKNPSGIRSVLKGIVAITSFIGLAIILGASTKTAMSAFKTADKMIKVISTGGLIEKWRKYKYKDIPTTVKDVAETINSVMAPIQLLDTFNVINLAKAGAFMGKIPVIGLPFKTPLDVYTNGLDILCSSISIGQKVKVFYDIKLSDNRKNFLEAKIKKWKEMPSDGDPYKFVINNERVKKWETKLAKIDDRAVSAVISIALHVSLIALMILVTTLVLTTNPPAVLPVAITIVGLAVSIIGMTGFIRDNVTNPDVKGIKESDICRPKIA